MVVRRGIGETEEQKQKQSEIESKLKDENKRRLQEKRDQEEKKQLYEAELKRQEKELEEKEQVEKEKAEDRKRRDAVLRQEALDEAKANASTKASSDKSEDDTFGESETDSMIAKVAEVIGKEASDKLQVSASILEVQDKALQTAVKHRAWLEERERQAIQENREVSRDNSVDQNIDLERIFGPGAAQLKGRCCFSG